MAHPASTRPRLRADVYPANLAVAPADSPTPASSFASPLPPNHVLKEKVRVVVTLEQVLVFADSHNGPTLIFSENLESYTPPPKSPGTLRSIYMPREATLVTESGKTLAFHRGTGCGCGSRLKSFNPFGASTSYSAASSQDIV